MNHWTEWHQSTNLLLFIHLFSFLQSPDCVEGLPSNKVISIITWKRQLLHCTHQNTQIKHWLHLTLVLCFDGCIYNLNSPKFMQLLKWKHETAQQQVSATWHRYTQGYTNNTTYFMMEQIINTYPLKWIVTGSCTVWKLTALLMGTVPLQSLSCSDYKGTPHWQSFAATLWSNNSNAVNRDDIIM